MKLNQKLIEQLRNGEIAAENTGTVEQLKEVLKAAFPQDSYLLKGGAKYYYKYESSLIKWGCYYRTELPVIQITDFYQPELFTGWAKDDSLPKWMMYFKDDIPKFGFNVCGKWRGEHNLGKYSESSNNRPATHEEIESTLIKEAKLKGYKRGVICMFGKQNLKRKIDSDIFEYLPNWDSDGGILSLGGDIIFYESTGQWAEIIEQPTKVKENDKWAEKIEQYKTNPIKYIVDGTEYSMDYQGLKSAYENAVNLTDESFMKCLPQIAHLACVVAYFKGLGAQATISDKGIIHEIIHLMTEPNEPTNDLAEIREKFNRLIQLV